MTQDNRILATEALRRLVDGNDRFARNLRSVDSFVTQEHREAMVESQKPHTIILCCADSRVPAELIFDCGLGELFVCRVAGNIAAPSIVGSVEFAAEAFGTELVVVMGHTRCGAVSATLAALDQAQVPISPNLRDIVDRIAPSVHEILGMVNDKETRLRTAIRANVRSAANQLRHGSRVLEKLIGDGRLTVMGAEYELETGRVHFFDGLATLEQRSA